MNKQETMREPIERPELIQRFYNKVEKTDSCWNWKGSCDGHYGLFRIGKKLFKAHRVAYEIKNGIISDDKHLDHLCRNKLCVNPNHLEIVTLRENILRGNSVVAKNARKFQCKYGHEFTPENTIMRKDGGRECKICNRRNQRMT